MINPDLVKVGDELYDVHREKMGNTKMSRLGCWRVRVISIEDRSTTTGRTYRAWTVSWNGNPPRVYYREQIARLRRSPKGEE